MLHDGKMEEQIRFWKEHLRDITHLSSADHPRPEVQTFTRRKVRFSFARDVIKVWRELSRRSVLTMFMASLAAFQVLLHR